MLFVLFLFVFFTNVYRSSHMNESDTIKMPFHISLLNQHETRQIIMILTDFKMSKSHISVIFIDFKICVNLFRGSNIKEGHVNPDLGYIIGFRKNS